MQVRTGQSIAFVFCTADPSSGNALEASSATGALWINGVVNGATVTVADDAGAAEGIRKVSYTVPTGLAEGDTVQCVISATVGGVTASMVARDDHIASNPNYPTAITYNAHGDIATVTWNGGKVLTYNYNPAYQLTGVTEA